VYSNGSSREFRTVHALTAAIAGHRDSGDGEKPWQPYLGTALLGKAAVDQLQRRPRRVPRRDEPAAGRVVARSAAGLAQARQHQHKHLTAGQLDQSRRSLLPLWGCPPDARIAVVCLLSVPFLRLIAGGERVACGGARKRAGGVRRCRKNLDTRSPQV